MANATVRGQLVDNMEGHQAAGDFSYAVDRSGQIVALLYVCPCGCGKPGAVRFGTPGNPDDPRWIWDLNRAEPTLTPSIRRRTDCGWHGHLVKGEWKGCA